MSQHLPRIAVTMGDPAGVGPELCLQLLANAEIAETCIPLVFGDASVLNQAAFDCRLSQPERIIAVNKLSDANLDLPSVVDCSLIEPSQFKPGHVNRDTGAASFQYIELAIRACQSKQLDAVCTGPINKEAWLAASIKYPGHTELFADRTGCDRYCMMMTSPAFSCSLVTTHVGYGEVPAMLTTELIWKVTELTHNALTRILGRRPKLAMLGLNPHAGENGLFGNREEEQIIAPAIAIAREHGCEITDPLPPDTAFLPWRREKTDGYICMYHDQGLIPFKAFNFDTGVNITLGLPMVRTSVDHGTALDIAWQGKADPASLYAAVTLAARLSLPAQA